MVHEKVVVLRYENLVREIDRIHPRRILEIGTYRGGHAEMMVRAAARHRPVREIQYWGFDLFAPPPPHEHTPRTVPPPMESVYKRLRPTHAQIILIQGDTRTTLPKAVHTMPDMDLVFIDGGHSTATVLSDWTAVQHVMTRETVVFFDDYWNWHEGGANAIVDAIQRDQFNVELLDPIDVLPRPGGTDLRTQFARVTRRTQ